MPSQFRIVVSLLRVLAQHNTHVCQLSPTPFQYRPLIVSLGGFNII